MLSLPTECYCMIFNNFRNNYKELLACALVNRHWCGIVMPIMWSEPKRKFRDERLIKIFLLTLNIEEQTLLIPYKMNFPTQPKPLLEYTNFITSITRDLYDGISFLPNLFGKHEVTADFRDAILISLIKMFLRTGKSLKSLYLEDIDCNHINIKDTTITSVELVLPQTVSDGFKRKTLDGLIDNLKETSTLTTLSFVSVRIGIKRMKKLIKIFYNSIVLNSLGVYSFPLGNRSGKLLATFLIKNTTLTSLHLTGKKSINSIGLRLGNQLGKALCENRTLKSLKLRYYNLEAEVGKIFLEVLGQNDVLTSLDLSFNDIGPQGGIYFAEALRNNNTLTSLELRRNDIGPEGGLALAEALCINTALTLLDVCENNIGCLTEENKKMIDKLPKAFGDALCMNTTLISLDISSNNLGTNVGKALGESLYKNISLEYLNLQANSLGSVGGKAIEEGLCQNITLTQLNLLSNNIDFNIRPNRPNLEILV